MMYQLPIKMPKINSVVISKQQKHNEKILSAFNWRVSYYTHSNSDWISLVKKNMLSLRLSRVDVWLYHKTHFLGGFLVKCLWRYKWKQQQNIMCLRDQNHKWPNTQEDPQVGISILFIFIHFLNLLCMDEFHPYHTCRLSYNLTLNHWRFFLHSFAAQFHSDFNGYKHTWKKERK